MYIKSFVICIFIIGLQTDGFCMNRVFTDSNLNEERDTSELSIYSLYKETLQCRDYFKSGKTSECLSLCNIMLKDYNDFPGAEVYLSYLFSYKAQCYRRLGDLELSRAIFLLSDWHAMQEKDSTLIYSNKINRSILESENGNYATAKSISEELLCGSNYLQKDVVLNNLAKSLVNLGELEQAGVHYSGILEMVGNGNVSSEFDEPLFYRNYGYFLHLRGEFSEAKTYLEKALDLYHQAYSNDYFQIGYTHKYLGEIFADMDSTGLALEHFASAINSLHGDDNGYQVESSDIHPVAYETVHLLIISSYLNFISSRLEGGEGFMTSEMIEGAIDLVIEAENRVSRFVMQQAPSSSVFVLSDKVRPLFDSGIQCAIFLYGQTGNVHWLQLAFEWSIKSKAYSLAIQVEKEKMIHNESGASYLFAKQKEILRTINLQSDPGNQFSEYQSKVLTELIFDYEYNNDNLGKITQHFNNREDRSGFNMDNLLEDSKSWKQNLVSYHFCNEEAFIFKLNRGKMSVKSIAITKEFKEAVVRFKEVLYLGRDGYYTKEEVLEFNKTGNLLYEVLLSQILTKGGSHSLIVQADGLLHGLPFGLLISETHHKEPQPGSFRDLEYLFKDYEISYWMGLNAGPSGNKKRSKKTLLITCSAEKNAPGMNSEINSIQANKAFETEVKLVQGQINSADLSGYEVIHFASHYSINNKQPLKSGLVCNLNSEEPYLTLDEIIAGDFNNSHVFINGCNSGNGKLNPGQGLMSMGLVFGICGADEVISHLWEAEDEASRSLSTDFYSNGLPENFSKRLNKVKSNYLESAPSGFDHPHFWGGIVCTGKPTEKSHSYIWVVLILLVVGIGWGIKWIRS